MSHQRFFIPGTHFRENAVILPENVQNQVKRVLRLDPGDKIIILNDSGVEFVVQLVVDASGNYSGKIVSEQPNQAEPGVQIWLYVSLTQREKFEWILQKGTETGVSAFCPFISRRSLIQKSAGFDKKRVRWESILREAAEQCGRGRVPVLQTPTNLKDAISQADNTHESSLTALVQEDQTGLEDALIGFTGKGSLGLFIGPEGGFDDDEAVMMQKTGLHSFSLGPRVLRMETAAILAPALVLYQLGQLK